MNDGNFLPNKGPCAEFLPSEKRIRTADSCQLLNQFICKKKVPQAQPFKPLIPTTAPPLTAPEPFSPSFLRIPVPKEQQPLRPSPFLLMIFIGILVCLIIVIAVFLLWCKYYYAKG